MNKTVKTMVCCITLLASVLAFWACYNPTNAPFPTLPTTGTASVTLGNVTTTATPSTTSTLAPTPTVMTTIPLAPSLNTIATYALFGGSAGMTNQGNVSVITGNIGTTAASSLITGFHNATTAYTETAANVAAVSGTVNFSGTAATQAASDLQAAYTDLAARSGGVDPGAGQLGGLTLYSGVYKASSGAFRITGSDLTLDAQGNADAVWIFQMTSSLSVGTATTTQTINLVNGALAKNVFWQVGSAATINAAGGGVMVGTIITNAGLAFSTAGKTAITTLNGQALSLSASVTLVNTCINAPGMPGANLILIGSATGDVTPSLSGGGYIRVQNNGAHVDATQSGTGTINLVNNGGVVTATNTGAGVMTILNTATAAVTITYAGDAAVTVAASGTSALTLSWSDGLAHSYP